jgi:hypothetical protein
VLGEIDVFYDYLESLCGIRQREEVRQVLAIRHAETQVVGNKAWLEFVRERTETLQGVEGNPCHTA